MSRLGISIYPEISNNYEKDIEYINKACTYGFKRVFTNLLSVNQDALNKIKAIHTHAKSKGMEIITDVSPSVFSEFDISYNDLSFFKHLQVDGIRLDEGFNGLYEAMMTYNDDNIKIELNASQDTKYIDHILSYSAYKDNLITCHNFYPQRYSGLSYEQFRKTSEAIKQHNLLIAAFVSSNTTGAFGPWPINDGLCTLEMHRDLSTDLQVRHLYATQLIDDIIIANMYASEEEFKSLSLIHPGKVTIKIKLNDNIQDIEKKIVFDFKHVVRGDMSEYIVRSTMPRIEYARNTIKPMDTPKTLVRGDICIANDNYGRYKGELHIILKDMENHGNINVIGHIEKDEDILLEFLTPWRSFVLIQ